MVKEFDFEEVGIKTKDMSFEDYLYLRVIALFVESLHNGKPFNEFFLYAKNYNIQPADFLKILNDNINQSSNNIRELIDEFKKDTKDELWDSEEKLIKYYKINENYQKLKNGEVGGNLIYKYKSKNLVEYSDDWLSFKKQLLSAIKIKILR